MRTKQLSLLPVALLLLSTWLLPTACINEPLVQAGSGGDGSATRVTLSVTGDKRQENQPSNRSLTPAQEGLIDNLHILVFDEAGGIITNEHFAGLAIKGTGSVSFETLPGVDRQIVVIANGDVNDDTNGELDAALRAIATLNDLKAVLVPIKGNGLARTDRLTMVGSTTVTINKPHAGSVPIALHYLAAKVTVSVKDNISTPLLGITITSWDVVNIPKQTYLHERTGNEQEDAVTGTKPGDYLDTAGKYNFEKVDPANKTWSQSFYVFENRRGNRADKELPTNPADQYPGMGKGDNDQRGKAWYAPPGATYMLIYGTHTPQDGQTNNIIYKIYLGENAIDDYNLFRGRHYEYNVTINGLNNINVDTNVEWGSASFSVDTSSSLSMDAHPDFRVFRIGGTAVNATTMAYATVEVLEPDGITPCAWLAVSPLNLYRHGIKQAGNANQQFAPGNGIGSFVRAQYKPTPTDESTFANSSFGMTRCLTRISFEQPAVYTYQNVILYADALAVPHTERKGKVKITYYKGDAGDEVAGEQTFDVSQQGPIQVSNNLYMERYEESGMLMHPGLASGLQGTEIMQWGYDTSILYGADDRYSNGNFLTANAVYTTVDSRNGMAAPVWVADSYAAYREKYPHQGELVTEPSTLPVTDNLYYYPALESSTSPSDYFHPVFNSSAARYCHEKNRDTNGDGVISKEETVWYLPSYADMVAIKKSPPATQPLVGTYWTSTEESKEKSWAVTFPTGVMVAADKTTTYRVRCVRGAGTAMTEPTFESGEEDKTKITLLSETGASGLFRITDDKNYGIEWTATSDTPDWLKIATDAKGTAAAATQTGTGDATLYAYAVTANPSKEESRVATLTFTRAMSVDKTIEVTQELSTAIVGGNSNCYLVAPGSAVSIPVERANESPIQLAGSTLINGTYHQLQVSTAWTASLVWESSKGLVALSEATGTGPAGRFNVTATNTSTEGNAVVAIKNASNEILWSWHIWVTAYDGKATFTTNNGKQDFVFMDRALGAASTTAGQLTSCGLYYQWGRKDPFPGIGQQGGSWSIPDDTDPIKVYNDRGIAYTITKTAVPTVTSNNLTNAIRHPDTYYFGTATHYDWFTQSGSQNNDLWSGGNITLTTPVKKSVFDPCPAGWRIAPWLSSTSPFARMNSGSTWGSNGRIWPGTGGYFPTTGCRYSTSGGVFYVGLYGDYWAGSPQVANGYNFLYSSGSVYPASSANRAYGFPVRCCQDNL